MKRENKATNNTQTPRSSKRLKTGEIEERSINCIRVLAADIVEKAASGHPGAPMGMAPLAVVLWSKVMNYYGKEPNWLNRDRFILSNGHACALQYIMLHLTGYNVTMDDLKAFRQLGSKTPGHPENEMTEGVEVSTGPLGQGISNSVGMAIAAEHMAAVFNKKGFPVIDHYVYVFTGDGCMQEGVASEACSLAGHLGLGRLIVLYDDNQITIDGDTNLSFSEDVSKRFEAYGWHTEVVDDGTDTKAVYAAIQAAKKVTGKPSFIRVKTVIGFGSSKEGTGKVHGSPLGTEDLKLVKKKLGFNENEFFVIPDEVSKHFEEVQAKGKAAFEKWNEMFEAYKEKFPELAAEFLRRQKGELPKEWEKCLPDLAGQDNATRKHSQACLTALVDKLPELCGGSADLTPSNGTALKSITDFSKKNREGRYFRFGVREHGMSAVTNGICAYGGMRPFCATFLNFIGYAFGAFRVGALSKLNPLWIGTHDSIGLGEDGPTHQPVEMLQQLRATPNVYAFRPADGVETVGSYKAAFKLQSSTAVLVLTRQTLPAIEKSDSDKVALGAYVVYPVEGIPELIMIGTGSELHLCVDVAKQLKDEGIKVQVVSMPCVDLYEEQPLEYKKKLFPTNVPILSVEASSNHGWDKYSHAQWSVVRYGLSAPLKDLMKFFGFTKENLVEQAKKVYSFYKDTPVPDLLKKPTINLVKDDE